MTVTFQDMFVFADPLLIVFFRIFENPAAGFFFGTFVLSLFCLMLGKATSAAIYRLNRSHYRDLARETTRMGDISVKALRFFQDKKKYRIFNKEANEAFGKYFFAQIALGASALWSIPFALGWMQTRFSEVSFPVPVIGGTLGYVPIFILFYVLLRMVS